VAQPRTQVTSVNSVAPLPAWWPSRTAGELH